MRFVFLVVLLSSACAHATIAGTRVPDTEENRAVYAVLGQVHQAIVARDPVALLAVISPAYFEDNGTSRREDDYGYEELKTKILPESLAVAKEVHLGFRVDDIVVEGDVAHADIRYESRTRLDLPSGALWDSHKEFNRMVFAREDGQWRVVSGL